MFSENSISKTRRHPSKNLTPELRPEELGEGNHMGIGKKGSFRLRINDWGSVTVLAF